MNLLHKIDTLFEERLRVQLIGKLPDTLIVLINGQKYEYYGVGGDIVDRIEQLIRRHNDSAALALIKKTARTYSKID